MERQPEVPGAWSRWSSDGRCQRAQEYAAVQIPVRAPQLCPLHTVAER